MTKKHILCRKTFFPFLLQWKGSYSTLNFFDKCITFEIITKDHGLHKMHVFSVHYECNSEWRSHISVKRVSVPLLRSSSSSSSSFCFLSSVLLFSEATHWIPSLVSFHSPLWSSWALGASLMKSSVSASANMAACSRWRKSYLNTNTVRLTH